MRRVARGHTRTRASCSRSVCAAGPEVATCACAVPVLSLVAGCAVSCAVLAACPTSLVACEFKLIFSTAGSFLMTFYIIIHFVRSAGGCFDWWVADRRVATRASDGRPTDGRRLHHSSLARHTRRTRMPFYPSEFDPRLICAQILLVQALTYAGLGMWLLLLNGLAGRAASSISLVHMFSYKAISLTQNGGWIAIAAYILNSVTGGCFLMIVVERAKKCLDFAATAHILHLCLCYLYAGFPDTWEWWVVNLLSLLAMSLMGEYLCMRREMQDILLVPTR